MDRSYTNCEPNCKDATMTDKLVETAQYMNEIKEIISQITAKLKGPEPAGECCEKGPWPPQIGIGQWVADNQRSAEQIRNKLRDIAMVL